MTYLENDILRLQNIVDVHQKNLTEKLKMNDYSRNIIRNYINEQVKLELENVITEYSNQIVKLKSILNDEKITDFYDCI